MTATIARLRSCATGPARFRAALRRKTRAIRTFRASCAPLGRVGAGLPQNVLGGDLLALLSDRLRAQLANEPDPVAAPGYPRAARSGPAAGPLADGDGDGRFSPLAAPAAHGPAGALVPPPTATERRDWPLADPRGGSDGLAGGVPGPAPAQTRARAPEDAQRAASSRRLVGEAGHASAGGRRATAATILSRQLADYWAWRQDATVEPRRPDAATGVPARERTPRPAMPGATPDPPAHPDPIGQALAERLRAFASGQPAAAPPAAGWPLVPPGANGHGEPPDFRRTGVGASTAPVDLADQLADILREQAFQHGVDLT